MEQIVIKRPRMVVVLNESEILAMLKNNPDLWMRALQRGKGFKRAQGMSERVPKY